MLLESYENEKLQHLNNKVNINCTVIKYFSKP